MRTKENTRIQALKTLVATEDGGDMGMPLLPFQSTETIKLLGLQLDRTWAFHDHMREMQNKLRIRTGVG